MAVALNGLERLLAETQVYVTLQNIAEFWNAATRPIENNGLGYSIPFTLGEVEKIEALLTFLAGHAFGLCRMEADCCRAWRFGCKGARRPARRHHEGARSSPPADIRHERLQPVRH